MKSTIRKIFNIRILLLIASIIVFVLINSTQENYIQVSQLSPTTLVTTDTFQTTTNTTETSEETEPPTFPTIPSTGTDPDNGGITEQDGPSIRSQVIPITVGAAIFILVIILVLQQRKSAKSGTFYRPKDSVSKTSVKGKREKFRTQINTLMEILQEYLNDGKFAEGIVFGFHQLDSNMKRILGIKREAYLTPKEFSQSMELPEIIQPLTKLIDIFYLARYRISPMEYNDLEEFMTLLQALKEMSKFESDIKIVRTENMGDEE